MNSGKDDARNSLEDMPGSEESLRGLDIPLRSLSAPASHEQLRQQLEQGLMALLGETVPDGTDSIKTEDCPKLGLQKAMGRFGPPCIGASSPPGIDLDLVSVDHIAKSGDHQPHAMFSTDAESFPSATQLASAADGGDRDDDFNCPKISPELQAMREIAASGGGLSGCTTAMIQNIPGKYTQRKLMHEINRHGFLGRYDFLYLPVDSRNHANRGFAFINFVSAEQAQAFYAAFHGQRLLEQVESAIEPLKVVPADVQGYDANVERYMLSCQVRKHKRHSTPFFLQPLHAKEAAWSHSRWLAPNLKIEGASDVTRTQSTINPRLGARFCQYCGNARAPSHSFCQYCGAALLPA